MTNHSGPSSNCHQTHELESVSIVPSRPRLSQPTQNGEENQAIASRNSGHAQNADSDLHIFQTTRRPSAETSVSLQDDEHVEEMKNSCAERMTDAGWCVHLVNHLKRSFDLKTFQQLALLDVSAIRDRDHTSCRSKDSCSAYNVDVNTYQTRHVDDACNCAMVAVPHDELIKIIRSGGVPLVSIAIDQETGVSRLQLHKRNTTSAYVAVSHVWADGLGNATDNSLPDCQLKKLHSILDELAPELGQDNLFSPGCGRYTYRQRLFWFDTLCVPLKKDYEDLHARSMDAMASIYGLSGLCLVLDADLMSISSRDKEIYIPRIILSTWMTRSWTLQEAVLAPRRAFRFAHHTMVEHSIGNDTSRQLSFDTAGTPLVDWVARRKTFSRERGQWLTWFVLHLHPEYKATDFYQSLEQHETEFVIGLKQYMTRQFYPDSWQYTWNALASRSTTQPDDLVHIFANLLGYKCQEVLRLSRGDHIPTILLGQRFTLPVDLLFHRRHSRDESQNSFRWLPTCFNREHMSTNRGLHVYESKPYMSLLYSQQRPYKTLLLENFIFSDNSHAVLQLESDDTIYKVYCDLSQEDPALQLPTEARACVVFDKKTSRGAVFRVTGVRSGGPTSMETFQFLSKHPSSRSDWLLWLPNDVWRIRCLRRFSGIPSRQITLSYFCSALVTKEPLAASDPQTTASGYRLHVVEEVNPGVNAFVRITHGYKPKRMKVWNLEKRNSLHNILQDWFLGVTGAIGLLGVITAVLYADIRLGSQISDGLEVVVVALALILISVLGVFMAALLRPLLRKAYCFLASIFFPTFSFGRWLETRSYKLDPSRL